MRRGGGREQKRLADGHGSQCGFCTPGFVMSMYSVLRRNATPSVHEVPFSSPTLCPRPLHRVVRTARRALGTARSLPHRPHC